MRYRIRHTTRYRYSEEVSLSHSLVTCQPRDTEHQQCLSHSLRVQPHPPLVLKRRDALGNWVSFFSLEQRHCQLTIEATSLVEVEPVSPPQQASLSWSQAVAALAQQDPRLEQWVYASPRVGFEAAEYARPSFDENRSLLACIADLNQRIHQDFGYVPGVTEVTTSVERVLELKKGVCQDFAHLMLSGLRAHRVPARYVSGYLLTTPPPGRPRLVGADASHAWISAWVPPLGWIDFDPTNNCLCGGEHILLAWGRDYAEVAPVRGVVLGGGQQRMSVSVDVQPDSGIFQSGDAFTGP